MKREWLEINKVFLVGGGGTYYFLDRCWVENGSKVSKNIGSFKTYDEALREKAEWMKQGLTGGVRSASSGTRDDEWTRYGTPLALESYRRTTWTTKRQKR